MANFPTSLDNFTDNVDDVMADDVNALQDKVGIDNDTEPTSLDYMLRTGYILVTETWTRTGDFTFTVTGDLTTRYRKGTKVRYKDGGAYEYGVVISSSYSNPNTTVTLATNTDYAMAATTITDTYISYIDNPEGFPFYFNFTPAYTGFSADPPTGVSRFSIRGTTCFYRNRPGNNGTSNANTYSQTLPVAHSYKAALDDFYFPVTSGYDGGVYWEYVVVGVINNGEASVAFTKGGVLTGWTDSGNKRIISFQVIYEI
jgi:hypothetical protein